MSKKDTFISEIEHAMSGEKITLSEDALVYFEALKGGADKEKPAFTENGKMVLQYMKDNKEVYNNLFKAKDVGEGMNITSRTASGAMRKLVSDGYIEKMGENPVVYSLTDKGIGVDLSAE